MCPLALELQFHYCSTDRHPPPKTQQSHLHSRWRSLCLAALSHLSPAPYLEFGFSIRKYLLDGLKVNSLLNISLVWCLHESMHCASCLQCLTGKGVPILILSFRPLRPPGTRRSTLGMLLNSMALRHARTAAFCGHHEQLV